MAEEKRALLEKIAMIRDEAGFSKDSKIETRGGSYDIWTEPAILKVLRPLFQKHRVLPVREGITSVYADSNHIKVVAHMVMYDLDSLDSIAFTGLGGGFDNSDKDAGKASTYAVKDAYLKLFTAVSGMDPDQDSSDKTEDSVRAEAKATLGLVFQAWYFHVKAAKAQGNDMTGEGWQTDPEIIAQATRFYQDKLTEIEEKPISHVANLINTMKTLLK